jgi:hypothetical protein
MLVEFAFPCENRLLIHSLKKPALSRFSSALPETNRILGVCRASALSIKNFAL